MKHKVSRFTEMGNQFVFSSTDRYYVQAEENRDLDKFPIASSLREISISVDDLDDPVDFEVWVDEPYCDDIDWKVVHESEFWADGGSVSLLGDEDTSYLLGFGEAIARVLVPRNHSGRISEFQVDFSRKTDGFVAKPTGSHELVLKGFREEELIYVGSGEELQQDFIKLSSLSLTFSLRKLPANYTFVANLDVNLGRENKLVLSSGDGEIIDMIQLKSDMNSLSLLRDEYGYIAIHAIEA